MNSKNMILGLCAAVLMSGSARAMESSSGSEAARSVVVDSYFIEKESRCKIKKTFSHRSTPFIPGFPSSELNIADVDPSQHPHPLVLAVEGKVNSETVLTIDIRYLCRSSLYEGRCYSAPSGSRECPLAPLRKKGSDESTLLNLNIAATFGDSKEEVVLISDTLVLALRCYRALDVQGMLNKKLSIACSGSTSTGTD